MVNRTVIEIATRSRALYVWPHHLAPAAGGLGALALAAAAEARIRQMGANAMGVGLYALAAVLFAVSAVPLPPCDADHAEAGAAPPARWGAIAIAILGAAAGLGLAWGSFEALRRTLTAPESPWLWLGAMAALMIACLFAGRRMRWPARWGGEVLPRSFGARALLRYALLALFVITVAARVLWLDRLPIGINPDEGDRAGRMALNIARGANTQSLFESGWYYISMVYFTLLAGFMKVVGLGFAQARLFHALCGIATAGLVTVIGIRNFGWRVGILAGAALSVLGIALQFSRVTTESTVTALCWTVSLACFYEAARRGRLWAWAAAGIAGGLSIYFYPSGRLWAALAALWCAYLFIRGPHRGRIALGIVVAAAGAVIAVAPYFGNIWNKPGELTLRFDQTSALNLDNARRLPYYSPQWSTAEYLVEQVRRSVFVVDAFSDGGGLWPHGQPITQPLTAIPVLVGLGWMLLRWSDPRAVALTLWFWVGVSGMATTVETPNVQRMATAIPALGLIIALVIDSAARRIEVASQAVTERGAQPARPNGWVKAAATAGAFGFAGMMMLSEARFYFVDYARMDLWRPWNAEAEAVRAEGAGTLVMTLARSFHMVTSGWTQLIALDTPKGGLKAPGSALPLPADADKGLTFIIYGQEAHYLPYLREIYPVAATARVTDTSMVNADRLLFTLYRVPVEALQARQGARVAAPGLAAQRVSGLGAAPRGWKTFPAPMAWTAGVRIEQSGNYRFRIGPGPARLVIDGREVAVADDGQAESFGAVFLARGDHLVHLEAPLKAPDRPALIEFARLDSPNASTRTEPIPVRLQDAAMTAPRGLAGTITFVSANNDRQVRIDNALATCCLSDEVRSEGRNYTAVWRGTLVAPAAGEYEIGLLAEGAATLTLNGQAALELADGTGTQTTRLTLPAGPLPLELVYRSPRGAGALELFWTPPQGTRSIIPPSALRPPEGAGIGTPLSASELGRQPADLGVEAQP